MTESGRITRNRILATAQRLFAKKGRDAVGIRELAAESGVSLNTITYHFGSKDNLYRESVTSAVKEGADYKALLASFSDIDFNDKQQVSDALHRFINTTVVEFARPEFSHQSDLICQALFGHDTELHRFLLEVFDLFEQPLIEFLAKAGVHPEKQVKAFIIIVMWSQMLFYVSAREFAMEDLKLEYLPKEFYEFIAHRTARLVCYEFGLPEPSANA